MHDFLKTLSVNAIILFAIMVAIIETSAQYLIKTHEIDTVWFFIGIYIYSIVGLLLYYAYKQFPISKFNVIWNSMSIIIAIVLGYFVFNEATNQNTIISLVFALLAIYFSNLNGNK